MCRGTDQKVDERIYEPLMNMLEAMKEEGLSPVVCSGYRTLDKQEKLFNRKVSAYVKKGPFEGRIVYAGTPDPVNTRIWRTLSRVGS